MEAVTFLLQKLMEFRKRAVGIIVQVQVVRDQTVGNDMNRHAQLRRLDGIVLDVLHRVKALYDGMARGLGA